MHKFVVLFFMLFFGLVSCEEKAEEEAKDAGLDRAISDMGKDFHSSPDLVDDVSKDLVDDLEQDATLDMVEEKALTLVRISDQSEFLFDDFFFGKNNDESLRVEAYVNGTGLCPSANDPTPDITMIITIDPETQVHNDAVILDFAGLFEQANPAHPSTLNVSEFTFDNDAGSLSMDINGEDKADPSLFSFTGKVQAIHCPSLDE